MKNNTIQSLLTSFSALLFLITLSSCATLNESECISADWEIIGLEDGSLGRATSYIGQHRQACASYNVTPNLQAYLRGHEKGTRNFCTTQNGFQQGLQGRTNNNTCPADLVRGFDQEYQRGLRIYTMGMEVSRLEQEISIHEVRLAEIETLTRAKEEELVSNRTSSNRRRNLLDEIKGLERESEATHIEVENLRVAWIRLNDDYQRLYQRGY